MHDLTKWFWQNHPAATPKLTSRLLQLGANVPAHGGVALAGGYLRDLYFGYVPKDMDFVFYGLTPDEFLRAVQMWLARTAPGEVSVLADYGNGDDYNGAKDAAIPCVIKVEWGGEPVDLILYNANTLTEVLTGFDHSINEFAANFDSEFTLTIGHHGGLGVCTRNADADLTQERVERMQEYARRVDWEYV